MEWGGITKDKISQVIFLCVGGPVTIIISLKEQLQHGVAMGKISWFARLQLVLSLGLKLKPVYIYITYCNSTQLFKLFINS